MNFWRALTLVVWVALCACTPPARPVALPSHPARALPSAPDAQQQPVAQGQSRHATASELKVVQSLMRETERIRSLRFLRPVDVYIQDPRAMRAYVSSALEQDELERVQLRYVALGLLEANLDVRALIEVLMEEELVGYYDPHEQRLAIRDDVAKTFASDPESSSNLEWRATVVHELVHALQDQHLGLGQALDAQRSTDADNAFGALVEGDATLAMLAYASGLSGVSLDALVRDRKALSGTLETAPDALTGAMRDAPAIVRDPLLFRYREGALFAAALVHQGGFSAVDAAHRAPPKSTREILEPQRYLRKDAPPDLTLPGLSSLTGAGYEVLDEDTLGRFELGIYLADHDVASGWLSDRYVVVKKQDQIGVFWIVRFASPHSARRAELSARKARGAPQTRISRDENHLIVFRHLDANVESSLLQEIARWADKP